MMLLGLQGPLSTTLPKLSRAYRRFIRQYGCTFACVPGPCRPHIPQACLQAPRRPALEELPMVMMHVAKDYW